MLLCVTVMRMQSVLSTQGRRICAVLGWSSQLPQRRLPRKLQLTTRHRASSSRAAQASAAPAVSLTRLIRPSSHFFAWSRTTACFTVMSPSQRSSRVPNSLARRMYVREAPVPRCWSFRSLRLVRRLLVGLQSSATRELARGGKEPTNEDPT